MTYLSNIFALFMAKYSRIDCQENNLSTKEEKEGINIKELETHNYSLRIKHPFSLKQEQKPPPWNYLATYWLAKDISNFSPKFHYLKNNDRVKATNPKTPLMI